MFNDYIYYLICNETSPYEFQEKAIKETNGTIIGHTDQYLKMEEIKEIDNEKVYILSEKENIDKLLENKFIINNIIDSYIIMSK